MKFAVFVVEENKSVSDEGETVDVLATADKNAIRVKSSCLTTVAMLHTYAQSLI
jgi:hypothetical protein